MFSNHPTIRIVIYCLAIAAQLAAVFVRLSNPDLAGAFDAAAVILAGVGGVTALSNITPASNVYTNEDALRHLNGDE